MKKSIVLLLCFYTFVAGAQVTVEKSSIISPGMASFISVRVLDVATDHPVRDAHVKLVFAPGDTVAMATDIYGSVSYMKRIPKDTLSLIVSHIGYKTIYYKYKPDIPYISFTVRLLEDTISMNAIIVKGDRIAMVLRGDTVFYNASAFKTMRGDNMEELLKKLPGVEFRNGRFYANGEPINRILINGTELFGSNTEAAGELIRADEVKNVKVYDYYSDEKRRTGDTLDAKERVLDVTTHEKIEVARQTFLGGSVGQFIDKNEYGNRDLLSNLNANRQRYKVGESFLAQVGYSKNSGYQHTDYSEKWDGLLEWIPPRAKKISFRTSNDFMNETTDRHSGTNRAYFASQAYDIRNYNSDLRQESLARNLSSKNFLSYSINNRNYVMVSIGAAYAKNSIKKDNKSMVTTDGLASEGIDMHQYDLKNSFSINNIIEYNHKFKHAGRSFNLISLYSHENNDENGWNIDTVASSIQQMFLENDANGKNNTYNLLIMYGEPVAKNTRLVLQYNLSHRNHKSRRIATDALTGFTDTLNTYDYTLLDLIHLAEIRVNYRKEKIKLSGSVSFQSLNQERDEAFPRKYVFPKTFNNFLFQLECSYDGSLSRFQMNYSENTMPLSVEELRGVVDNTNSLFLKAGNPGLKQSILRNLKISYNLTSIISASSWHFDLEGSIVSDYLATKTRYFSQPAELPEYNYTAAAGTTLETKENVKGRWTLNADVNYSKNSSFLESTLRAMLRYQHNHTPFFTSEKLYTTDAQDLSLFLDFQSGFSRVFEINLSSRAGGLYSEDNNNHSYKTFRISGYAGIRVNFLQRCWVTGNINYRYVNYISSESVQEETILNAGVSYKFGKQDRGAIGVHFKDILNQIKSIDIRMREDYIETSKNRILGRNGSISFSYKF